MAALDSGLCGKALTAAAANSNEERTNVTCEHDRHIHYSLNYSVIGRKLQWKQNVNPKKSLEEFSPAFCCGGVIVSSNDGVVECCSTLSTESNV